MQPKQHENYESFAKDTEKGIRLYDGIRVRCDCSGRANCGIGNKRQEEDIQTVTSNAGFDHTEWTERSMRNAFVE